MRGARACGRRRRLGGVLRLLLDEREQRIGGARVRLRDRGADGRVQLAPRRGERSKRCNAIAPRTVCEREVTELPGGVPLPPCKSPHEPEPPRFQGARRKSRVRRRGPAAPRARCHSLRASGLGSTRASAMRRSSRAAPRRRRAWATVRKSARRWRTIRDTHSKPHKCRMSTWGVNANKRPLPRSLPEEELPPSAQRMRFRIVGFKPQIPNSGYWFSGLVHPRLLILRAT